LKTRTSAVAEKARDASCIESIAKSFKVTQGHSKWHCWIGRL